MPLQLQSAFDEISAVIKKHDIAGIIILGSSSHTEYRMHFSPSWSCAEVTDPNPPTGVVGVHIRAKGVDYPSKEAHEKVVRETVGMVVGFIDVLNTTLHNMTNVLIMLGQHLDISHISKRDPRGDKP